MTINELAKELNTSTTDWLDAWTKATSPTATDQDLVDFMNLAGQKRDMAQQLVRALADQQLDRIRQEAATA